MTNSASHRLTVLVATILAAAAIAAHFLTHLHGAAADDHHLYIFNTITGQLVRTCHVGGSYDGYCKNTEDKNTEEDE
jgi:heme/copper-type cytochrome/quinol oxidase subunit 4